MRKHVIFHKRRYHFTCLRGKDACSEKHNHDVDFFKEKWAANLKNWHIFKFKVHKYIKYKYVQVCILHSFETVSLSLKRMEILFRVKQCKSTANYFVH